MCVCGGGGGGGGVMFELVSLTIGKEGLGNWLGWKCTLYLERRHTSITFFRGH